MAVTKEEVILEVKTDTSSVTKGMAEVTKSVEKTSDATEDLEKSTEGLTGQLDKLTGGAVSGFMAFRKSLSTTIKGMKSLKVAIAATGLGLLVTLLASLAAAFTSSEGGAQKLRRVMGAIGTITDNLMDLLADFGESVIHAFENPSEAIEKFGQLIFDQIFNRLEGIVLFIPRLAKAIGQLFERDFAGAAKTAGDAVAVIATGVENYTDKVVAAGQAARDFGKQIVDEAKQGADIAEKRNRALVLERELITERAEAESKIAAFRLKSRQEEEFSAEERGQALRDAQALEDSLLAKELELVTLRKDAQVEENKLARSSEENLLKEAEAIANVSRLSAQRLNQQRQTQRELNRINKEIARDQKALDAEAEAAAKEQRTQDEAVLAAKIKLEDELFAETLNAQEREELALMQKYDQRIAIAGDDESLILAATESFLSQQAAIEEKYRVAEADAEKKARENEAAQKDVEAKKDFDRNKAIFDSRMRLALGALSALSALNDAFSKKDDQDAEQAFKRNKAIALATATLNTGQAVVNALTAGGNPIKLATGAQFVEAGIAAATGAAQIANIARTQYEAPAPVDTSVEIPPAPTLSAASTGGAATGAPQLDLSFLGQGAVGQAPVQAFVISQDVTTAQQANQQIQEQASL